MRSTCTSWSWSLLPFEDVVRVMAILGFRAIDVGAFTKWAHFDAPDLAARPVEMAEMLNGIRNRHGVQYTDLFVTFGPDLAQQCVNFPDKPVRDANLETFKRITELCRRCEIPGISLCPGIEHASVGRAASLDLAIEELNRLAAAGHEAGLRVGFEPHVGSITESPEDALTVVRQAAYLTLTLDYSHFVYQGYADAQIEPLLAHAGHFHMRQAKPGQNQCRTHEGVINFERALTRLGELGYAGWASFEYVWEQWMDNDRMDVAFYDPYVPDGLDKSLGVRRAETLDELLGQVYVLTLHCPLTPETLGMIDAAALARMPKGSYLVNTARGAVVEATAIPGALASGQLAGAAIDVMPVEPPPENHPLLAAWRDADHPAHHRLIVNPHAAFYCEQGMDYMRTRGAELCRRALLGLPIRTIVNK